MITPFLEKIGGGRSLSRQEASAVLEQMIVGEISEAEAGALLMGLRLKGESIDEIVGFVNTLEKHMIRVHLRDKNAIDVCGTGGDGSHSFNVSTTAALVIAAGGATVAKHGNRSISSRCGSADVLEVLGVRIDLTPQQARWCSDEIGIGFFFAPLCHPAFKTIAPIRKRLGIRTVFNMLGPLLNPAQVRRQLIGAFNRATAQKLAEVLLARGFEKACTVHSHDGFDEVSPFAANQIFEVSAGDGSIKRVTFTPPTMLGSMSKSHIRGKDSQTNAQITLSVLHGVRGPAREMTVLNAAFGFYVAGKVQTIKEGIRLSEEVIDSGQALKKLNEFREMSRSV